MADQTIFERLETGLSASDVTGKLTEQGQKLSAVANAVAGLAAHPPQSLAGLGQAVANVALPTFNVGGNFAAGLGSVQAAVPADLSSVTGGLGSGLQQMQSDVIHDLVAAIQPVVDTLHAVYQLTQVDWLCAKPPAGPGPAPAAGPEAAPPAPLPFTADLTHALDQLPASLTVDSVLGLLYQATDLPNRSRLIPITLPILDDIRDPLETLMAWKAADANGVRDHLAATLQAAGAFVRGGPDAVFNPLAAELAAATSGLHAGELASIADGLAQRLGELQTAIAGGNLVGTGPTLTALTALLDQYDALRATMQDPVLAHLPQWSSDLHNLPDDLADQMDRLVAVLRPAGPNTLLETLAGVSPAPDAAALAALDQWLGSITGWLEALIARLDLSALQDPIAAVTGRVQSALNEIDAALANVVVQVKELFAQVEGLLSQVDVAALTAEVQAAITGFKDQLIAQLQSLFAPVQSAVKDAVDQISAAIDGFDPAVLVDELRKAIQAVTGVLQDPAVLGPLGEVKDAITQVADQIESISFAPLADEVIAAIHKIGDSLKAIDTSQLSPVLQAGLQAALAILPPDLTPFTTPLVQDFGQLLAEGPAPVLKIVEKQPAALLGAVTRFEPAKLVGDSLSRPYNELLQQMQAFQPSRLLQPVDAELNGLKQRLVQSASPGLALQPLEAPFKALLAAYDRLKPEDLVKPLQDLIDAAVKAILAAIPLDQIGQQVDLILGRAGAAIGLAGDLATQLGRLQAALGGLGDPAAGLDAWVEAILAKIDAIADTGPVATRLGELAAAIDATRAAGLAGRFDAATGGLAAALVTLNPQGRLTVVLQAYRAVDMAALDAVPSSPRKTAVKAALTRCDPFQPAFSAPYSGLAGLQAALAAAAAALAGGASAWDARYLAPGGALASLQGLDVTPAHLHSWVKEQLRVQFIAPLAGLLAAAKPAQQMLGVFVGQLHTLATALQSKVGGLLNGPGSFGAIRDAIQGIVDRLHHFNLGFLTDQLKDLFGQVRAKLAAVDPAQIRQTVDQSFKAVLDSIGLAALLPAGTLAALDDDFKKVIDKLKGLDPGKLVVEVVQKEYQDAVPKLLEPFDLTPVLKALNDRLATLQGELQNELDRINQAYQELRGSLPSFDLGSLAGAAAASLGASISF